MAWPLPQPADIADRAAASYEREYARIYALRNPGAPPAVVDARSPQSTLAVHGRVLGEGAFPIYLYQRRLAQELMPDTAVDWLPRDGAMWRVPRVQPTAASGSGTASGQVSAPIPALTALSAPGGALYTTVGSTAIGSGGTASVALQAAVAGAAGNLPPGTLLRVVNALPGLSPQTIVVDSNGIVGGADIEGIDSWRRRIVARIGQRGAGGDSNDFVQWTQEVFPNALVLPLSPAVGLITVAFALPNGPTLATSTAWRAPTSTEIGTLSAYLNDATNRKPLGAPVINVIAATLQPVNLTLHLNPDTATIRGEVEAVLGLYFFTDLVIGGTLDVSRSDAAISSAAGLYNFDRTAPSADVAPSTAASLITLGTVSFV